LENDLVTYNAYTYTLENKPEQALINQCAVQADPEYQVPVFDDD
jgi:hypothetical protein